MPSSQIISRMQNAVKVALLAAHTSSPSRTSSTASGVCRIASQVFWICMRENAPHSDSNFAEYMTLIAIDPLARNCRYETPSISGSRLPSP